LEDSFIVGKNKLQLTKSGGGSSLGALQKFTPMPVSKWQ